MSKIIFRGECVSSDDPKRLGRIRAIPKTEDEDQIYSSSLDNGEQNWREWSSKDPFVYLPLLPFFNNVTPKKGEYIHLIYSNPDNRENLERYYIGGVYSSPTAISHEPYDSAITNLDLGTRNRKFPNIYNTDGELFNPNSEGVFIDPKDVSIQGRGSSDLVIKRDTVLIRSGKNLRYIRGQVPDAYGQRGFLQISKFDQQTSFSSPSKKYRLETPYDDLKILVEYYIENPQTTSTGFTGVINIYNVKPSEKSNSKNFLAGGTNINLSVGDDISARAYIKTLQPIPKEKFSNLIKETIKCVANKKNLLTIKTQDIDYTLYVEMVGALSFSNNNLPIYYRPTVNQFNDFQYTLNDNVRNNLNDLFTNITIKSEKNNGYGLVFDEKLSDKPSYKKKTEITIPKKTENIPNTTSILGSDTIYLLSHKSKKPDSEKIDLGDSLYGINQSLVVDEIEPKTSSMVRGEELISLLEMIIEYLRSHVHPYPGMPPVSVASGGNITTGDLLTEIENAYEKILNQNIRIN
jgi:hypothetical protein